MRRSKFLSLSNCRFVPQSAVVFLGLGLSFILFSGCSGTKGQKITEKNKDRIMEQIKDSKDLTVGEVQLLQGYMLRSGLTGGDPLPVGKTIGELIEDQRKFVADLNKKDAEEKERVAKAKAIADEKRKVLLAALSVTEFDKGFEHIDYEDYNTMKLSYENRSGKDIRGFKGVLIYNDLFGDQITALKLKEDHILKNGQTIQVSKQVDYNQFIDKDKKLRETSLDSMKIEWQPEVILFTDGTSLSADPD